MIIRYLVEQIAYKKGHGTSIALSLPTGIDRSCKVCNSSVLIVVEETLVEGFAMGDEVTIEIKAARRNHNVTD